MQKRNRHIVLEWRGPFGLTEFFGGSQLDQFRCPGAYLWVEKGRVTRVGAVGSQPNLVQTMREHFQAIISGAARLPAAFRTDQKNWVPGKHPACEATFNDLERLTELLTDAYRYQATIQIYIAPCPECLEELDVILSELSRWILPGSRLSGTDCDSIKEGSLLEHSHAIWIDALSVRQQRKIRTLAWIRQ